MPSRVFIVEQPRRHIDTSTAALFGDLVYIFGDRDRRASVLNSEMYVADVIAQLQLMRFKPDEDYFCLAGSLIPVSQAMTALAVCGFPYVKVLLFNSSSGVYEEREINFERLSEMIGEKNASTRG